MGFLNDLGLDNVEADPNHIPDGQYPGFVYKSSLTIKKKDGTTQWAITYKVAPDAPVAAGKSQDEWFKVKGAPGKPETEPTENNKEWLKKRVLSLGVPESQVNSLDPQDVEGTAVFFTIVHRNGYQNIGNVWLRDEKTGLATQVSGPATDSVTTPNSDVASLM